MPSALLTPQTHTHELAQACLLFESTPMELCPAEKEGDLPFHARLSLYRLQVETQRLLQKWNWVSIFWCVAFGPPPHPLFSFSCLSVPHCWGCYNIIWVRGGDRKIDEKVMRQDDEQHVPDCLSLWAKDETWHRGDRNSGCSLWLRSLGAASHWTLLHWFTSHLVLPHSWWLRSLPSDLVSVMKIKVQM